MRAQTDAAFVEADGVAGPATRAALGIGEATTSAYGTINEFVDQLTDWLNDGDAGRLPADALTTLGSAVNDDAGFAQWSVVSSAGEVGGRSIVSYVLRGDGGIYTVMDICVAEPTPIRWCGIWYVAAH